MSKHGNPRFGIGLSGDDRFVTETLLVATPKLMGRWHKEIRSERLRKDLALDDLNCATRPAIIRFAIRDRDRECALVVRRLWKASREV